eukprot:scaffold6710_cov175-Amphora_coffeaeformis.AAC.4
MSRPHSPTHAEKERKCDVKRRRRDVTSVWSHLLTQNVTFVGAVMNEKLRCGSLGSRSNYLHTIKNSSICTSQEEDHPCLAFIITSIVIFDNTTILKPQEDSSFRKPTISVVAHWKSKNNDDCYEIDEPHQSAVRITSVGWKRRNIHTTNKKLQRRCHCCANSRHYGTISHYMARRLVGRLTAGPHLRVPARQRIINKGNTVESVGFRNSFGQSMRLVEIGGYISANGNMIAIGFPFRRGDFTGSGSTYAYNANTNRWVGVVVILSSDGTVLVVGGRCHWGHAQVYQEDQSANQWTQVGMDIDGIGARTFNFGYNASTSGTGGIVTFAPYGNGR